MHWKTFKKSKKILSALLVYIELNVRYILFIPSVEISAPFQLIFYWEECAKFKSEMRWILINVLKFPECTEGLKFQRIFSAFISDSISKIYHF